MNQSVQFKSIANTFSVSFAWPSFGASSGSEKSSEKGSEKTSDETRVKSRVITRVKILSAIRANGMIIREVLAQSLAMTIKGADWQIAKLNQAGVFKRIGPDKGGRWEVLP